MVSGIDALFQPFRLGSLDMQNRIVMAPMTRWRSPDGVPGNDVASYYRRRAENEVGLILSEGTVVDRPAARNEPDIPFFHGTDALAGWQHVIDEVHRVGGKMGPQLWHVGAMSSEWTSWVPDEPSESPSGLRSAGQLAGKSMSEEDMADTIAAFASAAGAARRMNFDVVEIHGAHGYLIDQFFWSETNKRGDAYGGASLKDRVRFGADVIKAVRAAVGPDMPVILRLSQWKQQDYTVRLTHTPAAMAEWLQPLVEAGVDILHCSQRRIWEPEFPEIDGEQGLNFAGWAKKLTGAATISVGSVGLSGDAVAAFLGETSVPTGLEGVARQLENGEFDLVAVGRALLADPDWATKVRAGDVANLRGFSPAALDTLV